MVKLFNEGALEEIAKSRKMWEKVAEYAKKAIKVVRLKYTECPVATPLDIPDFDYMQKLGLPGMYPYTRGWAPLPFECLLDRQYIGCGTPKETRKRIEYLMKLGRKDYNIAFDLPTQLGYDPDDEMAAGEVGRVGVSCASILDFEEIMEPLVDWPEEKINPAFTANAQANVIFAMYYVWAERNGKDPKKLRCTIQNDILKEYVARGTYIYPPKHALRLTGDIFEWILEYMPKANFQSVCGYHIREAGSTAVQEMAFMFANAMEYARLAMSRGIDINTYGRRTTFLNYSGLRIFEEVAKFRAGRRVWAKIMKEKLGATDPVAMLMRTATGYAASSCTAQKPLNNIVRNTITALVGRLAGYPVAVPGFDEALGIVSDEALEVAADTVDIIEYETDITETVDPLGGSYYVEMLTDKMEEQIMSEIEKIEEMGGALKAIESGYMQREIARAAYERQKAIERGEIIIIGVNKNVDTRPIKWRPYMPDPEAEKAMVERIRKLRAERDNLKVKQKLEELEKAARKEDENTMPYVVECVEAYATIGEICGVFRKVFGEYRITSF